MKDLLLVLRQFLATDIPLKWWECFFISPLKLFSFWRHLDFFLDFFGQVEKRFDKKAKIIFKIYDMTSTTWKQMISIHILPNTSKSKDNQKNKFGQLIVYNRRNIALEKSCTKCGGETSPWHFSKYKNWVYLWINRLKFYTVCIFVSSSRGLPKYLETKLTIWFYLI